MSISGTEPITYLTGEMCESSCERVMVWQVKCFVAVSLIAGVQVKCFVTVSFTIFTCTLLPIQTEDI